MKQQFETHRPVSLYVENGSGSVQVLATDTTESTVEVSGRRADEVQVTQDGDEISVIAPEHRSGFRGGDQKLDFAITVPTDSELVVKTGSADVTATGRYGSAKVKSGSGDVQIDALQGAAVIQTGSGDIRVGFAEQELQIKSGSGDVVVDGARAASSISTGSGDVKLGTCHGPSVVKTGSGDLEVIESHNDIAMSTGSGDLTVKTAHRGRLTAKGASGDVRVGIPAGTPVWTDITSVSGQIHSMIEGAGQPEEGADHIELRARTVSGDIVLTER